MRLLWRASFRVEPQLAIDSTLLIGGTGRSPDRRALLAAVTGILTPVGIVIDTSQGTWLPGSGQIVVKVRSEDTSGVMAVLEETLAPKQLIRPHTHQNDVWVYVLRGEIGVLVGEEIATAAAGSWALKPRNIVHAMWNAHADPARIMEVLTPAGPSDGSRRSLPCRPVTAPDSRPRVAGTASTSSLIRPGLTASGSGLTSYS